MPRIAFATCRNIPEPDVDETLLLAACIEANLQATCVAWEDDIDWQQFDLVVPRSTWNYFERPNDFREWIRRVDSQTKLLNPASLILPNVHKSYLLDLEEAGIPIVPTRIHSVGEAIDLKEIFLTSGWKRLVIKPAVSAASHMTRVFSAEHAAEAQAFALQILQERDVMVQEYMSSVSRGGELSMVHVDGALTHCIVKSPRFDGDAESVSQACHAPPEAKELGSAVIATIKSLWLYARVDVMLDNTGNWRLSELELIEPSLFFRQHPPALDRFVSALVREAV